MADAAAAVDNRGLDHEQRCPGIGEHAEMIEVPVGGYAVVGTVLAHGRDNDPVREVEIAQAVRAAMPKGMPLGARITGSDWSEGGLTPDDAVAFAKALKAVGLDFVCISSGGISADTRPTLVANTNVEFAEKVKREVGIATRTVGLIATPKQAETIIAEGKADMVALARAMLDDPHWGWHAAQKLGAEVPRPKQYQRAAPKVWAGASYRD